MYAMWDSEAEVRALGNTFLAFRRQLDQGSDSEAEAPPRPPTPKRQYLLTCEPVPYYSTYVERNLKIFDDPKVLADEIKKFRKNNPISSSEEEDEEKPIPLKQLKSRPRKFNQKFKNLSNSLSAANKSLKDQKFDDDEEEEEDDDDVVLVEPQELLLKVRCRLELHKVCILMTEPLRRVVDHMAKILKVQRNRIILLHQDTELSVNATPAKLGLSVASIIDCVVEPKRIRGSVSLRVQGKDRNSEMKITIEKGEPLESLMNKYKEAQELSRNRMLFYFDGKRLTETQTPAELGMESGDVIEVWK